MHLGALIYSFPSPGGRYASFGIPQAYPRVKFQNLEFLKNQKKAWSFPVHRNANFENSGEKIKNPNIQSTRGALKFVTNYQSYFSIILMVEPIRAPRPPHFVPTCSDAPELIVLKTLY